MPGPLNADTAISSRKKPKPSGKGKDSAASEANLKVVVRRLPPNLPEQVFWDSVQPWVNERTHSWKSFVSGKLRTGTNKENLLSRAYIAFKNEDQAKTFYQEYNGHLFRDKAGNESIASVEAAPFQKVPSEKKKQDARAGTIEEDEDFKSFVASLEDPESAEATKNAYVPAIPDDKTQTPLLAALLAEKNGPQRKPPTVLRRDAADDTPDAKKRHEQHQKLSAEDTGSFARRILVRATTPVVGPSEASPVLPSPAKGKGKAKQAKSLAAKGNPPAAEAEKSGAAPAPAPAKGSRANSSRRGGRGTPQPQAPPSVEPSPTVPPSVPTVPQPRVRPKFKFDNAIAQAGVLAKAGPSSSSTSNPASASTTTEQKADGGSESQPQPPTPKAGTKKGRVMLGVTKPAPTSPTTPKAAGSTASIIPPPPVARIDDDESLPFIQPLAVQPPERGRGRGNRSRGRGRGRGSTPAPPTA